MKVWKTLVLKEQSREVNVIAKSLANYLYKYGPINDIVGKYKISRSDKRELDEYTVNRLAGLLMLYIADNKDRINDIVNHYNLDSDTSSVIPILEGYIER